MVISEVSRTYGILALESPFLLARTSLNTISTGRLMMGIKDTAPIPSRTSSK